MDVRTGSITSPWRFGGRILESADGSTDLYDFSARSYDPALGAFTSFDSVTGGAQNPLTLNRYLYANANPATLVDPTGHFAGDFDDERGLVGKKKASGNGNGGGGGDGGGGDGATPPETSTPTCNGFNNYTNCVSPVNLGDYMGIPFMTSNGKSYPVNKAAADHAWSLCTTLGDQLACDLFSNYNNTHPHLGTAESLLVIGFSLAAVACAFYCGEVVLAVAPQLFETGTATTTYCETAGQQECQETFTYVVAEGESLSAAEQAAAPRIAQAMRLNLTNAPAGSGYDLMEVGSGGGLKAANVIEIMGGGPNISAYAEQVAQHWLKGPAQGVPLAFDLGSMNLSQYYTVLDFLGTQDPAVVSKLVYFVPG